MTIPENFKPLLAVESSKVKQQNFPMLLSEKLDGIRCICFDGVAYSRSMKPIPNEFIQDYFMKNKEKLEGLDGELIIGSITAKDVFQRTTSGVMSIKGEPNFRFWVFDKVPQGNKNKIYSERLEELRNLILAMPMRVALLEHFDVNSEDEILDHESYFLSIGSEGVMLRDPEGTYKFGRSGTKNPELQKVKRFKTEEFEIIGYEPKYINTNEAKTNELGHTERSTSRQGMLAVDTLGALELKTATGLIFSAGSGLTEEAREQLWEIRDSLKGKLASIKYFEVGAYEVPRFPVLRGIRDVIDLS